MIRNIFPLMLLFILVNPITRISDGETFFQDNSETLLTLSFQSSKILADFQGEDKMDTQRDESSPRALIHPELESNRINNLKINDEKSYSGIEEKALLFPKNSRAFLMPTDIIDVSRVVATLFVHSVQTSDQTSKMSQMSQLCYTPKTVGETVGESGIAQVELDQTSEMSQKALEISNHLKVDKVIELPSLVTPAEWEKWRTR
jgi:hypothetical protein